MSYVPQDPAASGEIFRGYFSFHEFQEAEAMQSSFRIKERKPSREMNL